MAKRKKQTEDLNLDYKISIGYVKKFSFNDSDTESLMGGHPKVGRLYEIVWDDVFGYRLHIGAENTKHKAMAGILLGRTLGGNYEGRWDFHIDIVTKENFIEFDINEEDVQKMQEWFSTDHKKLRAALARPTVPVTQAPEGGDNFITHDDLQSLSLEGQSEYDKKMSEFSDNINLIHDKDYQFFLQFTELIKYLASTYSDKYEAAGKTNYGKRFLIESSSPDTAIFNTMKYIQRYATTGFEKSGNIKDVYKAIHYLLFELQRKANNA